MKVLFITRKYPPQIGGMEKYSKGLIDNINCKKRVIALKRSQWHLIWFIPYSIIKGFFISKDCDLIYFCDSFMALSGLFLKLLTKKPVFITAHGLDVTYSNPLYQHIIIRHLKYLDKVICVSNSTISECVKRGVPRNKCVFIPNGIDLKGGKFADKVLSVRSGEKSRKVYKKRLAKFLNKKVEDKDILVTVGRLVKRKGVAWFVKNVMPKLDESIVYMIIGSGSDMARIKYYIRKYKLQERVFVLGRLSDNDLGKVCLGSDVFVMPNIKIKGDMEGFGIVGIEAVNWGLPIVAAGLEGIKDAIKHRKNGVLVRPMHAEGFVKEINKFLNDDERKRLMAKQAFEYNLTYYDWNRVAGKYLTILNK